MIQGLSTFFSWTARICLFGVLVLLCPVSSWAQSDTNNAAADSTVAPVSPSGGLGAARGRADAMEADELQALYTPQLVASPFFAGFTNTPKAGARANVRQNMFYGEVATMLSMRGSASFSTNVKWSFEEFRKQNKNVERRNGSFSYNPGPNLPLIMNMTGNWSWMNDKTVNTAGFANLFAQDNKMLRLSGSRSKVAMGDFVHSFKMGGSIEDRVSQNQSTDQSAREGTFNAGLQTGYNIMPGVVVAGRIYGTTNSGEKTLGDKDGPSSAFGDTVGLGVYFDNVHANGRIAITRSNFEKKYLDFRKNAIGSIDTIGIAENLKIVNELETNDSVTWEFVNNFHVGRVRFDTAVRRTSNDLNYQANGLGFKERELNEVKLLSGARVGADSLTVEYNYGWKWDDQTIQGATERRGRQFNKSRDLDFAWRRPLFRETHFLAHYHQGLSQDIAENEHNANDKDRLQSDFSMQVDRAWPKKFSTKLLYTYRQVQDISIRENRSSNNNVKDTYEITPSYTWYTGPWITWDQSYRLYIQFTDYSFSNLEQVSRQDNYNKRGNLTTRVTLHPTKRLDVVFRHDYNKKFNATKSGEDAAGDVFYARDLNQKISKLDMAMKFTVMPGVLLEAATYRTRDDRENISGDRVTEIQNFSGELWMGAQIVKSWTNSASFSAVIKKFSAFGPSVSETSASYWEADIWLKWEF
ncbi:MAG: hypothetical protein ACI9UQ_001724 [Candidatus Krumholzibacteriia bacterium]